ncbi:MAG: response regulator [Bacteroidia bacterium]
METLKIFIVDDDLSYASVLKFYIKNNCSTSADITIYSTGEKMLQNLKKNPDLIFLDFYLNGKLQQARNGLSILKKIMYRFSKAKVIMLSSQNNIEMALNAIKSGATEYIVKDKTEFTKVSSIVSDVVKRKEKRKREFIFLLLFLLLFTLYVLNKII